MPFITEVTALIVNEKRFILKNHRNNAASEIKIREIIFRRGAWNTVSETEMLKKSVWKGYYFVHILYIVNIVWVSWHNEIQKNESETYFWTFILLMRQLALKKNDAHNQENKNSTQNIFNYR